MKVGKYLIWGAIILTWTLILSCAQKTMYSQETPYSLSQEEQKFKQPPPDQKGAIPSSEAISKPAPGEKIPPSQPLIEETLHSPGPQQAAIKEEAKKKITPKDSVSLKVGLQSIFFDFDQAVIREDQKEVMLQNAQWLMANPQIRIRIEGNCDERGTAEYNLALGQRRADAAKEFLEGLGISSKRMQTISYGFERPLDPGHNEEAWAKNRRVDFNILK